MPRQNRVTPYGEIIATEARGTLMGNRGCLHDAGQTIRRRYQLRRWIICLLAFKGRRRAIMAPHRYTELFFLDEATALAAGHRPCAECQRARFTHFREHWAGTNPGLAGGPRPLATEIDRVLHGERIDASGGKAAYAAPLPDLPDGTFVVGADGGASLVLGDLLLPWAPAGYGRPLGRPGRGRVRVLTPRSVVATLAHGYRPLVAYPKEIAASCDMR